VTTGRCHRVLESDVATWIVTRVWRVEADTAVEAFAATDQVDHHRSEALAADLCRHPLANEHPDRELGVCIDCLAKLG
jgi:hypothetical protein